MIFLHGVCHGLQFVLICHFLSDSASYASTISSQGVYVDCVMAEVVNFIAGIKQRRRPWEIQQQALQYLAVALVGNKGPMLLERHIYDGL